MSDRAHARSTDPDTSHQAADAATTEIKGKRALVASYANQAGRAGFMDAEMAEDLGDDGSTLRSRRAELTEQNIILDSGLRGRWGDSARSRIIWVHRNHVANPPPVLGEQLIQAAKDAGTFTPPGPPQHLKQSALTMAAEFEGFARSFKAEGRSFVAERCEANARLLRDLAR